MSEQRQGTLLADARAGCDPAGSWQLRVEFCPPHTAAGRARRYIAVKPFGVGEAAAMVCKRLASVLRRGARVRVTATAEDDRRGRSWLMGVERIEAPDMPSPTRFLAKGDQ